MFILRSFEAFLLIQHFYLQCIDFLEDLWGMYPFLVFIISFFKGKIDFLDREMLCLVTGSREQVKNEKLI